MYHRPSHVLRQTLVRPFIQEVADVIRELLPERSILLDVGLYNPTCGRTDGSRGGGGSGGEFLCIGGHQLRRLKRLLICLCGFGD